VNPEIPVIDAPDGPWHLARMHPGRVRRIVTAIRDIVPWPLPHLADGWSRRCLARSVTPYAHEVRAVAAAVGLPGGLALNLCFELGCTTACHAPAPAAPMRLFRTLDWPFPLGADLVVARHDTPSGPYFNITWPGYVGVLTGMAPGRFALAINQPPMRRTFQRFGLSVPVDWMVNRARVARSAAIPPVHLSRLAFEQCATWREAKALLMETPVCIPVIYSLTGTRPGEGCVIERTETAAVVHDGPVCVTNHWLNPGFRGHPSRGRNSVRRLSAMRHAMPEAQGGLDWLAPPILNPLTRMAAELDAAEATLLVRGWHGPRPLTAPLTVRAGG
jgi:hypothetical protein